MSSLVTAMLLLLLSTAPGCVMAQAGWLPKLPLKILSQLRVVASLPLRSMARRCSRHLVSLTIAACFVAYHTAYQPMKAFLRSEYVARHTVYWNFKRSCGSVRRLPHRLN